MPAMRAREEYHGMTKQIVVAVGVAAAVVWSAGALAEEESTAPAAPAVGAQAQAAGLRGAMFANMDANRDGKVTLEEYQAAMAELAKMRFEAMDANKDGAVTEEEMRASRMRRGPGQPGLGRVDARRQGQGGQQGQKVETKTE